MNNEGRSKDVSELPMWRRYPNYIRRAVAFIIPGRCWVTGHDWQFKKKDNGVQEATCTKCGETRVRGSMARFPAEAARETIESDTTAEDVLEDLE